MDKSSRIAGPPPGQPVAAPDRSRHGVFAHGAFAHDDGAGIAARPGNGGRILIVEDDYLVGAQMETALTQAGFDVVGQASSVEEALELAASGPALAIVDIRLSGRRDGIDAARELYARHGIRCVFATAHLGPDMRARAAPAHPIGWLAKPYSMPALVQAVRRALRELAQPKS